LGNGSHVLFEPSEVSRIFPAVIAKPIFGVLLNQPGELYIGKEFPFLSTRGGRGIE
jgi:hypothetical protein